MSNGYALANIEGLQIITEQINSNSYPENENLKGQLRIGLQCDTDVTIMGSWNKVTQAYCSALPVAYSGIGASHWTEFARLILEATYEATLYAALINYTKTGNNKVFLTLVGGGAFGNQIEWVLDAIQKAVYKFSTAPLAIKIVSYGSSKHSVRGLVGALRGSI